MARRPMPVVPRGKVARRPRPQRLVLGCPKVSPEWELGALRALVKPQFKGAILHVSPEQRWPRGAADVVERCSAVVGERLGGRWRVHFPPAGDYHFVAEVDAGEIESAKALAVLVTRRLPGVWLTLGRWFVRDGKFFRRHRSRNLLFQPATSVHLTRAVRSALKGEL